MAGLAAVPFLWYAIPLFTDASYFRGDLMDQFFPWWTYAHQRLTAGEFPLWNPYVLSGLPFHVNPQAALFYPLNLPLFTLPFHDALPILRVLNSIVASWGMFCLLRRLRAAQFPSFLGALMFTYGSFMSYELVYLPYVNTMVWFPWQLLCLHKLIRSPNGTNAGLLALPTAASFLGGMPQVFFVCHVGLALFGFFMLMDLYVRHRSVPFRRVAGHLGAAVVLVFGMTLVLLWPALDFIEYSPRTDPLLGHSEVIDYSLITPALKAIFYPFYHWLFGAPYPPIQHIYLVEVPFLGSAAVLFALLTLRSRRVPWILPATATVVCTSVLLAKGVYAGFFPFCFRHLLPLRWFRWPYDYLHMSYPAIGLAAALGFDALWRRPRLFVPWFAVLATVYLALGAVWLPHPITLTAAGAAIALLLVILLLVRHRRNSAAPGRVGLRRALALILTVFLAGELWLYGSQYRRYIPERVFDLAHFHDAAAFINRKTTHERVSLASFDLTYFKGQQDVFFDYFLIAPKDDLPPQTWRNANDWLRRIRARQIMPEMWTREVAKVYPNQERSRWDYPFGFPSTVGAIFRFCDIGGYDPFMLGNVRRLYTQIPLDRNWNLFNVRYVATPNRIIHDSLRPVFSTRDVHIYENTNLFPRVMIPGIVHAGVTGDTALKRMKEPDFDPTGEALIEAEVPPQFRAEPPDAPATRGWARIRRYEPERVVVEAELTHPGALVLHDVFYPGWEAYADGRRVEMLKANYVFRACLLPSGKHVVEFRYRPYVFFACAFVSILSWLTCLGWITRRVLIPSLRNEHAP